jgi:hypothetical protein
MGLVVKATPGRSGAKKSVMQVVARDGFGQCDTHRLCLLISVNI